GLRGFARAPSVLKKVHQAVAGERRLASSRRRLLFFPFRSSLLRFGGGGQGCGSCGKGGPLVSSLSPQNVMLVRTRHRTRSIQTAHRLSMTAAASFASSVIRLTSRRSLRPMALLSAPYRR